MPSTNGTLDAIHYPQGLSGPARLEFETPDGKVECTSCSAGATALPLSKTYTITVCVVPDINPVPTPGG